MASRAWEESVPVLTGPRLLPASPTFKRRAVQESAAGRRLKLLRSSPVNSANTLRRLGVIDRLNGPSESRSSHREKSNVQNHCNDRPERRPRPSAAALAKQGTSSSYGAVGWGPVIPTISLINKDRAWNHDNQARYPSEDAAEYLRVHGKSPFAFF